MISEEGLQEFMQIYREEYGIDLSRQEATEKASLFLSFVKAILDEGDTQCHHGIQGGN